MDKSCHTAGICSGSLYQQEKEKNSDEIKSSNNNAPCCQQDSLNHLHTKAYHMVNVVKRLPIFSYVGVRLRNPDEINLF